MAHLYTIGHSTRPIEEFVAILVQQEIDFLLDIRTVPKSRHNPQYWGTELKKTLRRAGIAYAHEPRLGGLRKPRPDSKNGGWRNRSFQGYADYMETPEFLEGLENLMELGRERKVVIMCAETVPWRCHRNLVADALTVRGWGVDHLMALGKFSRHSITRWATVKKKRLIYAEDPASSVPAKLRTSRGAPKATRGRAMISKAPEA